MHHIDNLRHLSSDVFFWNKCPVWSRGKPPLTHSLPHFPHLLLYLLLFTFSLSYLLYLFSYFFIPSFSITPQETKSNATKNKRASLSKNTYNTKSTQKKTKLRFCCLLRPLAWKWSGPRLGPLHCRR